MTDKNLAVKSNATLANESPVTFALDPLEIVDGVQALTSEDLQIPRLVLVQPTHRNADVPGASDNHGKLYNDVTGEFAPMVNAVLLSEVKGRAAFDRKFDHDSEPMCASDDALMPRAEYIGATLIDSATNVQQTINEEGCATCPFSQFMEIKGETIAPLCSKSYAYAMIDAETGVPFVMRAQRTGTSAAKRLNTIASTQGRRKQIVITSQRIETNSGSYFVPVFSTGEKTPRPLIEHAARMSVQFGNVAARR